ncbi:SDR family oxidoreductase [Rhizobium sp. NFR03]|uniref:SDR family oxidoreductase n=1 Tax=Rhizobium sp. NFR03 TaxID=1566263 RepID=UPI0008B00D1E|nr:SDR family oxidoreductase [Rhizobium sp. NFR03]SES28038.1 NAD dependent epimerase/dehydratase family protein [Rhizobium sp. NFR03]
MTQLPRPPIVAVLGASGLIGEAICGYLLAQGHTVVPVARRFTPVQSAAWDGLAVQMPLVDAERPALQAAISKMRADVIVNCIGALQDAPGSPAARANRDFVATLVDILRDETGEDNRDGQPGRDPRLLVHVSIPGDGRDDLTDFSREKRAAEATIAGSGLPFIILHPGFVHAEAAFGGSALMRALAVLPFDLPEAVSRRPFAVTDARDIGRTVEVVLGEWTTGRRAWQAHWDIMEAEASTVGSVLAGLARRLAGPKRRIRVPGWMLTTASRAGDLVSRLGWRPPVRSTALVEMARGVTGDPAPWRHETGLEPLSGPRTLAMTAATVQERWFARLYLLKAMIIGVLVVFWVVSGGIALTVAFDAATRILTDHGFAEPLAKAITIVTSLMDISIGLAILHRRTCRIGLLAGIGLSLFYMVSAALITPDMWIEPLGALVKTGPSIILMMVGLAVLEER